MQTSVILSITTFKGYPHTEFPDAENVSRVPQQTTTETDGPVCHIEGRGVGY